MKSFAEVYEEMKKGETDAEIARRANLDKSTLSKLKKESIPANRNYLWSLSFALKANIAQVEQLFAAGGLCFESTYHLSGEEKRREEFLKKCMESGKHNVIEINIELYEMGYKLLGTPKIKSLKKNQKRI